MIGGRMISSGSGVEAERLGTKLFLERLQHNVLSAEIYPLNGLEGNVPEQAKKVFLITSGMF